MTSPYQAIARVFGPVLIVVGLGAIGGGVYDHSYVSNQLKEQQVTMPTTEQMAKRDPADQAVLAKYAGQQLTTGPMAQAFAEHILKPDLEKMGSFQAASTDFMSKEDGDEKTAAKAKRDTIFMGQTLRALLLNAYGWWLIGTVAIVAGALITLLGALVTLLSLRKQKAA